MIDQIDELLYSFVEDGTLICDPKFTQQYAFVQDMGRSVCAQTTVRAGKSTGLSFKYFRAGHKYPNVMMPYIALTRDSAKHIMWPILIEASERLGVECDFIESKLECVIRQTGASIKLFGADMPNFINRLKGIKTPLAAVDESQDFKAHLEALVENILIPRTSEYDDGQVVLTGTPGPVPRGYFYDASQGKNGYSVHKWSLFDNPYFPTARQFVQSLIEKKAWRPDNPTLLREYYGQWVLDTEALLIQYYPDLNDYNELPISDWVYILGIDLGFNDADALAVIAWSEKYPATYLVDEIVVEKQGLTELVEQIKLLESKYKISKMVIDEGGLGKKLAEELRRRHHIPVQPADKARKMENIGFLNDALRTGRFKAKLNSRFTQDSYFLQKDKEKTTPDRIVVKSTFHSDIIDAVLYAFKESPAFTYQAEITPPKYRSKEWASAETKRMEEDAEEYFKNLEDAEKNYGMY